MFLFIIHTTNFITSTRQIQIHLMFLFIGFPVFRQGSIAEFKYISCSYLSKTFNIFADLAANSNTSHVLIYLIQTYNFTKRLFYSNTSHVLIYLIRSLRMELIITYSNTSHVLIYRCQLPKCHFRTAIQIHLMFLFIVSIFFLNTWYPCYSNTSHVLIYPDFYIPKTRQKLNSNTSHVLIYQIFMI